MPEFLFGVGRGLIPSALAIAWLIWCDNALTSHVAPPSYISPQRRSANRGDSKVWFTFGGDVDAPLRDGGAI
jgi:hypothetical protein